MGQGTWRGFVLAVVMALAVVGVAQAKFVGGTAGPDRLVGTPKADIIKGKAGKDTLIGRAGPDRLFGGPGPDTLKPGPGRDEINTRRNGYPAGGAGDDRILARDKTPDLIDCGGGTDTVVVDKVEDGLFNCENIKEPS